MKQLPLHQIEGSKQIQDWLEQFPDHRTGAIELLMRLRFVTIDEYAYWLKQEITQRLITPHAIFVVRKFEKDAEVASGSVGRIWDENGMVVDRPAQAQGSEDLVQSVVANLKKNARETLLDHPSIGELREKRIRDILLLDDSIGSGTRVAEYIARMLNNKHFKSWWSYGFIKLHILAFARTAESETEILSSIGGSDHPLRKFPISSKVNFYSRICYARNAARERWGPAWQHVYDAARSANGVHNNRRLGFKDTMSNIVFYHSVPNNLPGALWFASKEWSALLPQRTMKNWLLQLLAENGASKAINAEQSLPKFLNFESVQILVSIKCGFRTESRISWHIGLDRRVIIELIVKLRSTGFITLENRLTDAGFQFLKKYRSEQTGNDFDRDLYIPSTWCAGRTTVQPPVLDSLAVLEQAESADSSLDADGEVGQTSLERTDAKTAPPSLDVMTETPAVTWNGHDIHGPKG